MLPLTLPFLGCLSLLGLLPSDVGSVLPGVAFLHAGLFPSAHTIGALLLPVRSRGTNMHHTGECSFIVI